MFSSVEMGNVNSQHKQVFNRVDTGHKLNVHKTF